MKTRHPWMLAALCAAALACGQRPETASASASPSAGLSSNGVTATMTVDSWGAGYCANISLANASTAAVTSWTLVAALNGTTLNNLWGGTSSVSGGQLTIKPVDYNTNIAPGASVTLGFCGTGTGQPALSTLTVVGGSSNPTTFTLTVAKGGQGGGTVASTPTGIACGSTCSASFSAGTVVTLTATPDGSSTFTGWSGACSGTAACTVTMSAAQSVMASFGAGTTTNPTLTVVKAGTGSGTVGSTPAGIDCGAACSASYTAGTVVTLTAAPASGSTFVGWSSTCAGFSSGVVALNASCTVTATFDSSDPGTSVSVNAGGAASGTFVADAYFSGGSTYSVTTAIDTTQLSGTVPAQAVLQSERYGEFTYTIPNRTPNGAQTVTLYFDEVYWTAAGQRTFNVAINGTAVLTAFDIFAAAGGTGKAVARTFNATANASGQVVIAFTKGGGPDNPKVCGITVAGGSVTTFPLTVTKAGAGAGTVTSTPSGVSCGSTCSASFASGALVTLSAAASSGSTFAGWSGGCSGTSTCTVTMSTAQSVTATFNSQVTTYALTVTKSGAGSGTVTSSTGGINCGSTCSANIASGTTVTLTAAAASGSTFAGWSNGCTGTSATCTVSMTAARAVTATFNGTSGTTSPGCGKTPGISSSQYNNGSHISITAAGMQRRYILNVPTNYDNTRPYRLVIAYHELNGNDDEMYRNQYYHLLNLSQNSTIFVAPNGQQNGASCSSASGCGWPNPNGSDIALADAVVAQVSQNFCVDMSRIFVTGWSYGGSMSYKTSCERPAGGSGSWSVRGAAVYSGAQLSGTCTPSKPVAYYHAHGTNDTVLSYDTGLGLFQNFARANGCTYATPTRVTSGNHVCTSLSGCTSGFPAVWCSFNGGHTPDPSDGGTSWQYQTVWNFISQF